MGASHDDRSETYRAKVDQQDGGPASHTEDGSGGTVNDVASGGVSERRNEDDEKPEGAADRGDEEVGG